MYQLIPMHGPNSTMSLLDLGRTEYFISEIKIAMQIVTDNFKQIIKRIKSRSRYYKFITARLGDDNKRSLWE